MLDIILRPQTPGTYDVQAYRSEQLEPFIAVYPAVTTHGVYDVFLQRKRVVNEIAPAAETQNYTLALDSGSFTFSGQNVGFTVNRTLSQSNGSFAVNGQALGLTATRSLTLANGSFALNGQSVELAAARSLTLANGSLTLTGQAVGLAITATVEPQTEPSGGVWNRWWDTEPKRDYSVNVRGASVRVMAQPVLLWLQRNEVEPVIVVETPVLRSFDLFADGGSVHLHGGNVTFDIQRAIETTVTLRRFDIAVDTAVATVSLGTIATSSSRVLTVSGNTLTITTGGGRAMLTTVTPITRKTAARSRQRPTMQIDSDLNELLYADTV